MLITYLKFYFSKFWHSVLYIENWSGGIISFLEALLKSMSN